MPSIASEPASQQQRARNLIARLELVSHGTTRNYSGMSGHDAAKVVALPPGGVKGRHDHDPDHELLYLSHLAFQRRLAGCRVESDYRRVADDLERALASWLKARPAPRDSVPWREMIARDRTGTVKEIAQKWAVSARYVYQLRRQYREQVAA